MNTTQAQSATSGWLAQLHANGLAPDAGSDGAPADGSIYSGDIGEVRVVDLKTGAACLAHAAAAGGPATLVIQRTGRCTIAQDGRLASLGPVQMGWLCAARDYTLSFETAARQTLLLCPVQRLRNGGGSAFDTVTATRLPGPPVLADLLLCITDHALQMAAAGRSVRQHAGEALLDLLAATLAEAEPGDVALPNLANFHVARIKQHILANLGDSELSVRKVSESLKISPAHIHRLFQNEQHTFSEWLWSERLLACRDALADRALIQQGISQIAFSHGFNNSSHFSRAFRAKFGISPSSFRAQALK